ncbi:MAG: hypothetical protein AAGC55_07325 [Myxococcota bacterium]
MEITFVRTAQSKDRIYVHRDDGSETAWSFPSYGPELPHDLYHLIIESSLAISDGIWARVARGADLKRINAQANRTVGKLRDKYRGLGDDIDGVLLSEALVVAPWSRAAGESELLAAVREAIAAADISRPVDITAAAITATRSRLDEMRQRWRALGAQGSLRFAFPGGELLEP